MKLNSKFKKVIKSTESESWEEYKSRLHLESDLENPLNYFLFHVIADHYFTFISRFYGFELKNFVYEFKNYSTSFIVENVEFDDSSSFDTYIESVKENNWLYNFMKQRLTFPFPIVIFEFENNNFSKLRKNRFEFKPFHLIEGVRRVSFLKLLNKNGIIKSETMHKVLVLKPILRELQLNN